MFDYYLFDTNPPALNMGMELYNAVGEITFSLGRKPLRVAGVLLEPALTGDFGFGNSSQKFAYAPMRSGFTYNIAPGSLGTNYLMVTAVSAMQAISGGVRTSQIATAAQEYSTSDPPVANPPNETQSDWLILDVTNY